MGFHDAIRQLAPKCVEGLEQAFAEPGQWRPLGRGTEPWVIARLFPGRWRLRHDGPEWFALYEGSRIMPRPPYFHPGGRMIEGQGWYIPRKTREEFPDHDFGDDWPPPGTQLPRGAQHPQRDGRAR